jgi:hypothetical protein
VYRLLLSNTCSIHTPRKGVNSEKINGVERKSVLMHPLPREGKNREKGLKL